jgi:hypothetical protein
MTWPACGLPELLHPRWTPLNGLREQVAAALLKDLSAFPGALLVSSHDMTIDEILAAYQGLTPDDKHKTLDALAKESLSFQAAKLTAEQKLAINEQVFGIVSKWPTIGCGSKAV